MDIEQEIAATLGFPKLQYVAIERERRWLCRDVPRAQIGRTELITDLYVTGTRLRLREARPIDGGPAMLRLSRKADVNSHTRLITSIYLPEEEFAALAAVLPGVRIKKLRHRLPRSSGIAISVDEFQGNLKGLVLVEAEFDTQARMAAFPMPDFAIRDVTEDSRYHGGNLANHGLPE